MNDNNKIIREIETENFVWIIYLFIIGLSFIANKFEKDYYLTGNSNAKEKYRIINIFIFSVALLVYLYFFKSNYNNVKEFNFYDSKDKIKFNNLNLAASTLIVIAGIILLYIAIYDENLDTEIAFN